jgi:type III secretion protein L
MEGCMYCFKLIKEGMIHTGKEKIIRKEEFEELLSAKQILEKAKEESEKAISEAHAESIAIKEKAYDEGFQEGLNRFNDQMLLFEDKLKVLKHELQKAVLPLVLKATRKIIGAELKQNPDSILSIVMQSIKSVTQAKVIKLYVCKSDLEILESEKDELKKNFENLESFQIEERSDIEPGSCIIETERGILNATLENQYRALERALEAHMKSR